MKGCIRTLRRERAFTLIEVMVALTILLVGVFATIALIDTATGATLRTRAREGGTNLARELTEAARGVPYDRMTKSSIRGEIESQPGLNDSSPGGGWTIRRREITYRVTATVCAVDDPSDGKGPLDGAAACPGQTSGSTGDTDPSDYKRLELNVTWTRPPDPDNMVTQSTIVNNPGNATGPTIDILNPTQPALTGSPLKITDERAQQGFQVTTSNTVGTVAWSVNGNVEGDASGSGTAWSFNWQLGSDGQPGYLYDGTYEVGAQAFLASGVFGPLRSVTVTLNRRQPIAPAKFLGGRNGDVIEFEWLPNPEADVTGYRVYRLAAGEPVGSPVCATQEKTACLVANPPPDPELDYGVLALNVDSDGNLEEGDVASATVRTGNNPPNDPSGLTAEREGDATTLDWTGANPADPDAGDELLFYRVYRDGTAYEDRYDITGSGSETTYTDTRTDGVQHTYWVTAVDSQLAESMIIGPVEL